MGKIFRRQKFNQVNEVTQQTGKIIHKHFPLKYLSVIGCNEIDLFNLCHDTVQSGLLEDLDRFAKSDPAAKEDVKYVFMTYRGFRAMLYYRVAHSVLNWYVYQEATKEVQQYLQVIARRISEEGKVETGIDIHPAARIGPGCVIDHGIGTKIFGDNLYDGQTVVVGETVIIGRNCTILNDIVIGSGDVNQGQQKGRRQPKIGNDVTICAGARLYGKIEIGNNVFIGAKCIICHDIPSDTKVTLNNQYQMQKKYKDYEGNIECDGLIKEDDDIYILGGREIGRLDLRIIDENYEEIKECEIEVMSRTNNLLRFKIRKMQDINRKEVMLKLILKNSLKGYYYSPLLTRELLWRNA